MISEVLVHHGGKDTDNGAVLSLLGSREKKCLHLLVFHLSTFIPMGLPAYGTVLLSSFS
jgi:hypothetical protein